MTWITKNDKVSLDFPRISCTLLAFINTYSEFMNSTHREIEARFLDIDPMALKARLNELGAWIMEKKCLVNAFS